MNVHGGDIYHNQIYLDYSVNLSPLGTPEQVKEALKAAFDCVGQYPDIGNTQIRELIAKHNGIAPEEVVMGNGASESIMAIVRTVNPKRAILWEPSFYGYRYALEAAKCEICPVAQNREDTEQNLPEIQHCESVGQSLPDEEALLQSLSQDTDLLFLNDPCNPTGKNLEEGVLERILERASECGTAVVLDESFYALSDKALHACDTSEREYPVSGAEKWIRKYPKLFIVRSYTKLFAIPGVRAGYVITNRENAKALSCQLPEWNISCFGQKAMEACEKVLTKAYLKKTVETIQKERTYLCDAFAARGYRVYDSDTVFFLIQDKWKRLNLKERLLEKGILIRDCSNFKGLPSDIYRIAVKDHASNEMLVEALDKIEGEGPVEALDRMEGEGSPAALEKSKRKTQ